MNRIRVYLLKSFGVDQTGGNPAGVVLDADTLSDKQKLEISKEVNFSETAFVEKSNQADFKIRFFTPTGEVDLCGHATIATYSLMFQKSLINSGIYKQELKAGVLGIEIQDDGLIIMEQSLPKFSENISPEEMSDIFGESIVVDGLSPQIVSTGLRDIMLPVKIRNHLFSLKPNYKNMSELNKRTNTIGIHAFTLDTIDQNSVAHCRNFAPLYGINEESATGSSNGALACYLYENVLLTDKNLDNLKFEQGYSMNKPSEIFVKLEIDRKQISKVSICGKAVLFDEKDISIG